MGTAFDDAKWAEIIEQYDRICTDHSECSERTLAKVARISKSSASIDIKYYKDGPLPSSCRQGHRRKGVGTMKGLGMNDHFMIYQMYLDNPARPRQQYVEALAARGINISEMFVTRWFHNIGPFKANLRLTSKFPPAKFSLMNQQLLAEYLQFVACVYVRRLVFADEKPFKGIDICPRVRRNPFTGETPHLRTSANAKNRYNVLAMVTLKPELPLFFRVVEETEDAILFQLFVTEVIAHGALRRGDIFVVDNCTIHLAGENEGFADELLVRCSILMITLPPYYAELNPTKLVFQTLVTRMRATRARLGCNETDLLMSVNSTLADFTLQDSSSFYSHCGYFYTNENGIQYN